MNHLDELEQHIDHIMEQRKILEDICVVIQNSTQNDLTQHQLVIALIKINESVCRLVRNNATEMKLMRERIKMQQKCSGLVFQQYSSNLECSEFPLLNDSVSHLPLQPAPQSLFSSSLSSTSMMSITGSSSPKYTITAERITKDSSERLVFNPVADNIKFQHPFNRSSPFSDNNSFSKDSSERLVLDPASDNIKFQHSVNRNNPFSDMNHGRNRMNPLPRPPSDEVFDESTMPGDGVSMLNIEDISYTSNHIEAHCSKLSSPMQHSQPNCAIQNADDLNNQQILSQKLPIKESKSPSQLSSKNIDFGFQSSNREDRNSNQGLNSVPSPSPLSPDRCLSTDGVPCCTRQQASIQEIRNAFKHFINYRLPQRQDWFVFERYGLELNESEINHIEENYKNHAYAAKHKKLEAWCKTRSFTSFQDVVDQLEKAWEKTFKEL